MASSFQFRNVTTYVVEPEGEPIQSLPSKSSLDFSPQSSCIEEAPNDGNQYARQSKSWQEVVVPTNTSDLNNDSGFITDSSLTKENIVGLKIDSTPEFADTQITPLAVEATYTPTVWSYLVGLFTTVPKSALQHFVKIWGVVNNLAVRIGLLEDKYILKYVVPVNTASIELTTDRYGNAFNFVEGTILEINFKIEAFVGDVASRIYLRLNNTDCTLYWNTTTLISSNIPLSGGVYYGELTRCNFTFYNGEIQGYTDSGVKQTSGDIFKLSQRYIFHTLNLNATSINSIILIGSGIPAGTVIFVKKI